MSAIIARPSAGATPAASASPSRGKKTAPITTSAANQTEDFSDWRTLIRQELEQIYDLLARVLYPKENPAPLGLPSELSAQAEVAIRDMLVAEDTAIPWKDDITAIAALNWPCFSMQAAAILQQQATGACTVAKAYSAVSTRLIAVCAALELTHDMAAMTARLQEVVPMPIRTQPRSPTHRAPDGFEIEALADQAIRANFLVDWCIKAQSVLGHLDQRADDHPDFAATLGQHDIAFRNADWHACRMDEGLADVLAQQARWINRMAGGAA